MTRSGAAKTTLQINHADIPNDKAEVCALLR